MEVIKLMNGIYYTDQELIQTMKDYNKNIGFPKIRDFVASKGLPCARNYIDRFGSFQNGIKLAGIEIPDKKKKDFNRKIVLSNEEILSTFKRLAIDKLNNAGERLTAKDVNESNELPSMPSMYRKFGKSLDHIYELCDIDINIFKQQYMIKQYINLSNIIQRTPTSRDLDKYCKNGICSASKTYIDYFGSMFNLQKMSGLPIVHLGMNKTDEEMIQDLIILKSRLGRTPTIEDLFDINDMASGSSYLTRFGSFVSALKLAGMESTNKHKRYTTKNGTICLSRLEHLFAQMLEKHNIKFLKDEPYSNYISFLNKRYTCDFVVFENDRPIFIEIFGFQIFHDDHIIILN